MAITAQCPGCGQTLSVQDQYAGMQGKCPTCGTVVSFPAAAPAPLAEPVHLPAGVTPSASAPAADPFACVPPAPSASWSLATMDPQLLTYLGLGIATFFYLWLLTSPFLNWGRRPGDLSGSEIDMLRSHLELKPGTRFGDGRMLFCLALAMLVVVALNFLDRRFLPQSMLLAGAFATFAFLMMLGRLGGGGAGIYIGLFGALGAAAACLWTAVRHPFVLATPHIQGGPSFFRTYGGLLGAEAAAFVFGVFYWLLRAIFATV
jgi:hypothetical protein